MMPTPSAKSPRTADYKVLSISAIALLLVTGCGAKEELSPSSGPASSSASASSGSSVSAGATAAVGESASSEASVSETQRYSGGSKAPEGEYRPANEHGPAQNVPKPVELEGMNEESEEGLKKFLAYWEYSVNYATQTGDTSYAEKLISEDYKIEHDYYAWLNEVYSRGGWVVGALRDIYVGENLMYSKGDGAYGWAGTMYVVDMYAYLGEHTNYIDNSSTKDEPVVFEFYYRDGEWVIGGVKVSEVSGG